MMQTHKVRIVRVTNGVAYADDKSMDRLAAFSFGKIEGYRGQTAEELGLRPGREVTLVYDAQDKVDSVSIASQASGYHLSQIVLNPSTAGLGASNLAS